jgi:hypothetical protein
MQVLSVRPTASSASRRAAIALMLPALLRGVVFISGLASPFVVALLIR